MAGRQGGKGGGARKIGRNKEKCKKYRDFNVRGKNKVRKLAKLKRHLEKAGLRHEGKSV